MERSSFDHADDYGMVARVGKHDLDPAGRAERLVLGLEPAGSGAGDRPERAPTRVVGDAGGLEGRIAGVRRSR